MNLQSGLMVTDNLRLVRQIGEGGMGTVWVAHHLTLDTEVAVKFMAPELATHPDAVARFTREAKSAARMRSPHVVKIFDYGLQEGGVPYMTMELLEGEDLDERVSRAGRLSARETIEVVTQLSKALSEAHACGVVHRDIKPDNVFLMSCGDDFFVKVLDFGIAKSSGASAVRVTCSGTTIGTPIYMSPEQILSAKDVDYRCDLWSLAVVAYYCLTGRVPFEGETFGAVCIAVDRGRMVAPSELQRAVPRAVDAWFARALARDIGARFRSAKEMADAFVVAMGAPVPSRSLSFTLPRLTKRSLLSRQPTLNGAVISASVRRASSRRTLTTFASVAAMALLLAGAMDLGRVLFGRPPLERTALLASPPLAYAETVETFSVPPRIPTSLEMASLSPGASDLGGSAPKQRDARGASVADEARVIGTATPIVAAARPLARASEGGAWLREAKPRRSTALVANAVPSPDPSAVLVDDPPPVEATARPSATPHAKPLPLDADAGAPDGGKTRAERPSVSTIPAAVTGTTREPDDTPVL